MNVYSVYTSTDISRARWTRVISLFIGLCLVLGVSGCDKKCQKPPEKPPTTLSETQWRLVETTDSSQSFKNLDRFSFIIINFRRNFSGDMQKVEMNDLFETPVKFFKWKVPESGLLYLEYQSVQVQADSSGEASVGKSTGTGYYQYDLGKELVLTDMYRGFNYRYVPFMGVVDPDSTCAF